MGAGPGGEKKSKKDEKKKKKGKNQKNFSVMIVFSSLSYTQFCEWQAEQFVNKGEPHESKASILNKTWSCPDCDAYGPCNETIFIDCGSEDISKFKDSDGSELNLTSYLSYAISMIIELLYNRSEAGYSGVVTFKIIAVHPCQKCLFALSELLGNPLEREGLYSPFVSHIMCQDEYRLAFLWIQKLGWLFNVEYCAVFDPFESSVADKKGGTIRLEEMERQLTLPDYCPMIEPYGFYAGEDENGESLYYGDHKTALNKKKELWINEDKSSRRLNPETGKYQVLFDDAWMDYDALEAEHESIVNPSEEQLKESVSRAKENLAQVQSTAKREKDNINKAKNNQHQHDHAIAKAMVQNLVQNSDDYRNSGMSDDEITASLESKGLIRKQHWKEWNTSGLMKALQPVEEYKMDLYVIDGKAMNENDIKKREEAIDATVAQAKQNLEEAQKALKQKQMAFVNGFIDALQLVAGIGSIFFPPLALVDAYITVAKWVTGPELSGKENALNAITIGLDVLSLIPYFGTLAKMAKGAERVAGEVAENTAKTALKALDQEAKVTAEVAGKGTLKADSLVLIDQTKQHIDEVFDIGKHLKNMKAEGIISTPGEPFLFKAIKSKNNFKEFWGELSWHDITGGFIELPSYLLISYGGISFIKNIANGEYSAPEYDPVKKKQLEEKLKEDLKKNNYDTVKNPAQGMNNRDGFEEYQKAYNEVQAAEKAKKNATTKAEREAAERALANAKERQKNAEALYEAQTKFSGREDDKVLDQRINAAENQYNTAYNQLMQAQGTYDRSTSYQNTLNQISNDNNYNPLDVNSIQNTSATIDNLNYLQSMNYLNPGWQEQNLNAAQNNFDAAEDDLYDAQMDKYDKLMDQVNAQIATNNLNYMDNYAPDKEKNKDNNKKSKKKK